MFVAHLSRQCVLLLNMEELVEFVLNCDDEDAFSDFEEAILQTLTFPKEKIQKCLKFGRFDLVNIDVEECVLLFRFEKSDLNRLCDALGLPSLLRTENRYKASGLEALCMLLRRLAYPNRLSDLEQLFGVSGPCISEVCRTAMNIILTKKKVLLEDLGSLSILTLPKFQAYAQAVSAKGAPVRNCWGFIDGTAKGICRPSRSQEDYYSGHKRQHCVKYQSIVSPDGLIVSLHGPYMGRRHDAAIFRESNIYSQLERHAAFPNNKFTIYGDSAYPMRELLLRPFGRGARTAGQERFDAAMSSVRQAVEWGFGKINRDFAFVDFKKNQKLLLQDVGGFFSVAAILTNCHTCLYGSQIGSYFAIESPELEQYLTVRNED